MKHSKLRIAWSVAWGTVAVLLCVLWVRSYWWIDGINWNRPSDAAYYLVSARQELRLEIIPDKNPGFPLAVNRTNHVVVPTFGMGSSSYRKFTVSAKNDPDRFATSIVGFWLLGSPARQLPVIPDWFAVLLLGVIAAAPWARRFRWRFSLRTLLIATTLVAVVLGLLAYVSR